MEIDKAYAVNIDNHTYACNRADVESGLGVYGDDNTTIITIEFDDWEVSDKNRARFEASRIKIQIVDYNWNVLPNGEHQECILLSYGANNSNMRFMCSDSKQGNDDITIIKL